MKKLLVFCVFLAIFFIEMPASGQEASQAEPWTLIPAGGKPAYMGIHGGTMPVSLLVSHDGSSLFTFVGRTGNDFLEVLRQAYEPFPSFGNATNPVPKYTAPKLFAGNATTVMPVIALSGDALAGIAQELQPFGLSEAPLRIEGQVARPKTFPHSRSFRLFSWPDNLKPKK